MKIKVNNAVGPQVRSAKPKTPKLLPILGGVSLVGGLQAARSEEHTSELQSQR